MMNCAPDVAKSSPLIAVRPRTSSPACHAVAEHRRFSVSAFVSRLLPQRSTATSRLHRPCRVSQTLHSAFPLSVFGNPLNSSTSHRLNAAFSSNCQMTLLSLPAVASECSRSRKLSEFGVCCGDWLGDFATSATQPLDGPAMRFTVAFSRPRTQIRPAPRWRGPSSRNHGLQSQSARWTDRS
jgi:hypothetical protein